MIQKQQKAPNIYGLLSSTPTSMLAAAIRELSSAVDTGHVIEPRTILGGILELIRTPAALDELPYVKIGYSAQSTLVNALTACLDPSQVKFKSKGILEADAKTRLLALNALIDIHDIVVDKNSSVIPSLGVVGRIIPKIIVHDMTDSKLMNAYHERLKGWAPFVAQFGDAYEAALDTLYQLSIHRGHGDEMTMGWVRKAKRELHTIQFMASNGTNLNLKLG